MRGFRHGRDHTFNLSYHGWMLVRVVSIWEWTNSLWKDDLSHWCMIQNWADWMNGLWKDEHEWWCSLLKWYVWPWKSMHESHGWWIVMSLVGSRINESQVWIAHLVCGAKGFVRGLVRQVIPQICFLESKGLKCYRYFFLCICLSDHHHVTLGFLERGGHMIQIKSEKVVLYGLGAGVDIQAQFWHTIQ